MTISTANNHRIYLGQLRFQERGSNKRRYLQQLVKEVTDETTPSVTCFREFFEDIPLVDEQGLPVEAAMHREPSDRVRAQR